MQSGVSVSGNNITGTLYYQSDPTKALVNDWGAGYFLALKFSNFAEGLTFEDVQVGLDPSEGSGLVTLDADCNGVFKITDKATQKLKVVQDDGTVTNTQVFDLSGLTLAPTESIISPQTAVFDKNENGANYGDKVFTVTPAAPGVTISKVYLQTGNEPDPIVDEEPPQSQGDTVFWTLDSTGLVVTIKPVVFGSWTDGDVFRSYVILSNDELLAFSITIEDTT